MGNELMSLDFIGFGWWVSNGLKVKRPNVFK